MGGMGSLYIGVSGLQTSQNALNTTAHNLANIGTKGYVRQQVVQSDLLYNTIKYGATSLQQVGIGSTVAQVRQVRDVFLDQTYRLEGGRANFYETGYGTYYEIESILGTLGGSEFSDSLEGLRTAFAEFAKYPTDPANQTLLKQRAGEFIDDAQNVYTLLKEYQYNLNDQVVDTVDRVNTLTDTIYNLNMKISEIEMGGIENANDLRDARNMALDELGGLINITYSEGSNKMVSVRAEGVPVIGENFVYKMGYKTDDLTGFVTPTWPVYKDAEVYNMSTTISTAMNTDVGKLKGLLIHRGNKTSDYTDIPVEKNYKDATGNWATGNWTVNGTNYTDGEKAYTAAKDYYNNSTSMSGMMNTLAEFDQLIHGVVATINDILCPNTTMTVATGEDWKDADGNSLTVGNTYKVLDLEKSGKSEDGTVGIELFSREGVERYKKYTYTDGSGKEQVCYVYNEENAADTNSMYTTEKLMLNTTFKNSVDKLPMYKVNGVIDMDKAAALSKAWTEKFAALNPNETAGATFEGYYGKLVDAVGNMGSVYKSLSTSLEKTVSGIDDDRQMVLGVSSDEELSNMIKYQNAYNASSRYINVVSEMLEQIVTRLGNM